MVAGAAVVERELAPVVSIFDRRRVEAREVEPAVSKKALASFFGVSTKTVERWMYSPRYARGGRQVPFEKTCAGGDVRFRLGAVETWMREGADHA